MDERLKRLEQAIDYAIETDYEMYGREQRIHKRLEQAKQICVFGTGGFFEGYHTYLKRIDFLCDNDEGKSGMQICGLQCYTPDKLKDLEDVVVIIMVGGYQAVQKQLEDMGIENYPFTDLFINVYTPYHEADWFQQQKEKIIRTYDLFEDECSQECYVEAICHRIAPHLSKKTFHEMEYPQEYFNDSLYEIGSDEVYVDVGAFDGDTVEKFIEYVEGNYHKIYAFELDQSNYHKMQNRLHKYMDHRMELFNYGCSNIENSVRYLSNGTGSNIDGEGGRYAKLVRLDDYIKERVTLLKMDIEGAELDALDGAKKMIARDRPRLAISVYHRLEDLWEIPLKMKELNPGYQLYMRHHSPLVWDTDCYAI